MSVDGVDHKIASWNRRHHMCCGRLGVKAISCSPAVTARNDRSRPSDISIIVYFCIFYSVRIECANKISTQQSALSDEHGHQAVAFGRCYYSGRRLWNIHANSVLCVCIRDAPPLSSSNYCPQIIPIEFTSNIRSIGCATNASDEVLHGVHTALVKYVFLAYAGMRWDNKFGDPKKKCGSKHNVSHRTNIQCMTVSKSESNQGRGKKRKAPSQDMVACFGQIAGEVITRMRSNGNNVATEELNKLSKIQMSALLYVCYDQYASIKSMNANQLKTTLDEAIQGGISKLAKASNLDATAAPETYKKTDLDVQECIETEFSFEAALAQIPMP